MRSWRPLHRGMMEVATRDGSGKTKGGLHVQVGLYNKDLTRRTKMVADVLSTYGTREVNPGDTVLYRYGMENPVVDSSGEEHTFLAERHCLLTR
jgi:hypothetical protein